MRIEQIVNPTSPGTTAGGRRPRSRAPTRPGSRARAVVAAVSLGFGVGVAIVAGIGGNGGSSVLGPVVEELAASPTGFFVLAPRPTPFVDRARAAADILDWQRQALAVHPLGAVPEFARRVNARVESSVATLPRYITREALFHRLAVLSTLFEDSHTTVVPDRYLSDGARLLVRVVEDEFCLERPIADFPAGSCFESFGVVSGRTVLDWCRAATSGETAEAIDINAPRLLPVALRALGVPQGAATTIRTLDGATMVGRMPGPGDVEPQPRSDAIEFQRRDDGIAQLTLRTLVGSRAAFFKEAFARLFRALDQHPPRGLIIDLRDNDGGSTVVAEYLLSYLTRDPIRMMGQKRWRVSEPMQRFLRDASSDSRQYLDQEPGGFLSGRVPLMPLDPQGPAFEAPVVFLSGAQSRSAAMMMLDAVTAFDVALVVGEPPSSPPNYFGEVYEFRTPHAQLLVTISTAHFVRANADAYDDSPVAPHVEVRPTFADVLEHRDPVMEAAVGAIASWRVAVQRRATRPDSEGEPERRLRSRHHPGAP